MFSCHISCYFSVSHTLSRLLSVMLLGKRLQVVRSKNSLLLLLEALLWAQSFHHIPKSTDPASGCVPSKVQSSAIPPSMK